MTSDALYPIDFGEREYPLGTDIGGVYDLDYALTPVSGRTALAHAILRRLTTRRGALFYAPNYGFSVVDLIGSSLPVSVIEQGVLEQALAEEEVDDASATATITGASVAISISVRAADGPFDLTLTVSDTGQPQLNVTALLDGLEVFSEAA